MDLTAALLKSEKLGQTFKPDNHSVPNYENATVVAISNSTTDPCAACKESI